MNTPRYISPDVATCGPFTWMRVARPVSEEVWTLVLPEAVGGVLPTFCVKNYGGEPGPGFAGWKLVSGGPFDSAGAYRTRDEAFAGVVPWLVDYLGRKAAEKINDARAIAQHLSSFLPTIQAKEPEVKTDWQVSHTENQGRTSVVFDLSDSPDDPSGLSIHIKGRGHGDFAEKLVKLLNECGMRGEQ